MSAGWLRTTRLAPSWHEKRKGHPAVRRVPLLCDFLREPSGSRLGRLPAASVVKPYRVLTVTTFEQVFVSVVQTW